MGRMRTRDYIVNIPSGSYNYAVFYNFGYYEYKLAVKNGGVIVEKNENKLATVNCKKNIIRRVRSVKLKLVD